ncbi:MAG: hypothetical protein QM533_04895 [Cytophagales bacterium]|nr:hypothetical protein [Cytophagales bacterium]
MNWIIFIKLFGTALSVLMLSAFTFGHEEGQDIEFAVRTKAGEIVTGAICKWSNDRTAGEFVSPSKMSVRRAWGNLVVVCQAGQETGKVTIKSQMRPSQHLSIFLGQPGEAKRRDEEGISREYLDRVTVRLSADFELDPAKSTLANPKARRSHAGGHQDSSLVLPPSKFAEIDDIGALPNASQACIDSYSKYVSLGYPKAFAITDTGRGCQTKQGIDSIKSALELCERDGTRKCYLYAIDNDVVWKKTGK